MVKARELSDLGLPEIINKPATSNNDWKADEVSSKVLTDLKKNINNDSQLQQRNSGELTTSFKNSRGGGGMTNKDRGESQLLEQKSEMNVDVTIDRSNITGLNMSDMPNNYQVSFEY